MSEPAWVPLGAAPVAPAAPIPTGALLAYGASTAPTGWLLCDGTAVSRTTYADLFAILGTKYGAGDGSTTFNVPDMRGRVPVGVGTPAAVDAIGDSDGVAVANRRPQHRHTPHSHTVVTQGLSGSGGITHNQSTASATGAPTTSSVDGGSGVAADSLDAPAYLVHQYIIKT